MATPAIRPAPRDEVEDHPRSHGLSRVRHGRAPRFSVPNPWLLAAALAAIASLATTLARLPELLTATYRFSDAPALAFYAQSLSSGHGPLALPTQTSVGMLWFDELISVLPIHAFLEYVSGPVLTLVAFALVVRAAHLAGGRRLATLTAMGLAVLPPVFLWPLLFPDNHVTTVLGTALLLWHFVRDMKGRHSGVRRIVVGLATGLLVVTDPQLAVTGVLPYVVVHLALASRFKAAIALQPSLVTAVAAAGAVALSLAAMAVQGLHVIALVPSSGVMSNIAHGSVLALQTAGWAINGGWYGSDFSTAWLVLFAMGACAVIALGATLATVLRPWKARNSSIDPVRSGYALFLILSIAVGVAVFVGLGYGFSPMQGHYLMPAYVAAATLVPAGLLALDGRMGHRVTRRSRQIALTLATVLFALFATHSAYATATVDPSLFNARIAPTGTDDPLPVLLQRHLTRGYSGYWEAFDLDWRANGSLSVWPVLGAPASCDGAAGNFCAFAFAPEGEYRPTSSETFIITPASNDPCISAPAATVFGPPSAVYRAGRYTISVYRYDVAARFSMRTRLFC